MSDIHPDLKKQNEERSKEFFKDFFPYQLREDMRRNFLNQRIYETSNEPRIARKRRLDEKLSDLKNLVWEMYELDREEFNLCYEQILQFSNLVPRKLRLTVMEDLSRVDFRQLIIQKMQEKQYTIVKLAEVLEVARPNLNNFLNDKVELSVEMALKIQKEFKIDAKAMLEQELDRKIRFEREMIFRPRKF